MVQPAHPQRQDDFLIILLQSPKTAQSGQQTGSSLPVLQLCVAAAHHCLLCHDVLPDSTSGPPRGRRQPQADDYDLRTGALWLCGLYDLRVQPFLPQEIQTARDAHGNRRLQKATCPWLIPGSAPAQLCLLTAWYRGRHSLRLSPVERFPTVYRGQPGDAAAA